MFIQENVTVESKVRLILVKPPQTLAAFFRIESSLFIKVQLKHTTQFQV